MEQHLLGRLHHLLVCGPSLLLLAFGVEGAVHQHRDPSGDYPDYREINH